MSSLLEPSLPALGIRLPGDIRTFEELVTKAAASIGRATASTWDYAGPGTLILDVKASEEGGPDLRFVFAAANESHVRADPYKAWSIEGPTHDEYVSAAKEASGPLLAEIFRQSGRRIRLSVGPRDPLWDWDRADVDCRRLHYAKEKLGSALDSLMLHPGTIRDRLEVAFLEIHLLRSEALPAPLRRHLEWILHELTKKDERVAGQGRMLSTLGTMRKQRAVEIATRIVALHRAVCELCP